jgi:predicted DNA binding CopG/RHH family protein
MGGSYNKENFDCNINEIKSLRIRQNMEKERRQQMQDFHVCGIFYKARALIAATKRLESKTTSNLIKRPGIDSQPGEPV